MRADWQRELTQVQADLGTEYVRFHGLLNDDMSVVVRGKKRSHHGPDVDRLGLGLGLGDADATLDQNQTCTFVQDQDFADPGANVYNASSKAGCCALCYNQPTGMPTPCVAAVYTPSGQCTVRVFRQDHALDDAIGSHACSIEALACV
jgi:hypothetical protein